MPLIRLLAPPEDDNVLPPPPPLLRGAEFSTDDLLLELHFQRQRAKQREAGFLSIIVHLCLILFVLLSPRLFQPVTLPQLHTPQQDLRQHQLTYLELPPELIKHKPPVHPKALSDQNRHFNHQDKITNSISSPVNRPAPRPQPSTPPPGPPTPTPQPAAPPPAPAPQPVAKSHAPDSGLKLENVPAPIRHPKLLLNIGAEAQLQHAIAAAARDQAQRGQGLQSVAPLPAAPPSGGGSAVPGQTGEGVQILTDTQGVDFSSYMQRIIEIVRRNWYAVMPETVYLGTKGRVVIVFNINTDGTVPGLHPIGLSGTASLDHAAEAAISASNPFPPLPSKFHGPFITLQFSFYYNLQPPGQ